MEGNSKNGDKRHSGRSELLMEVKYEGPGVRAETRISDISENGVFVDAITPLPAGALLKLTFALPDGSTVEVEGRVAHCQPAIGMGIEFINLKPEDAEHIAQLAKTH
ncbi:MAG TPA: PilZ domain-containing protein [Blastocatellia bacterium]|nr:PilZ domain-containing protein [Blastocatellia bacterium]